MIVWLLASAAYVAVGIARNVYWTRTMNEVARRVCEQDGIEFEAMRPDALARAFVVVAWPFLEAKGLYVRRRNRLEAMRVYDAYGEDAAKAVFDRNTQEAFMRGVLREEHDGEARQ